MGFFGNKSNESNAQRNPDAVFGFRVLAAGYVLYLVYQSIQTYISGEATSSIWLLIASVVILGGGAIYILISSYLSWRKEKAEIAARAEAEAESAEPVEAEKPEEETAVKEAE